MKKKLNKKLVIRKEIITALSNDESKKVVGGYTTSWDYCTGWLCCTPVTAANSCPSNCHATNA